MNVGSSFAKIFSGTALAQGDEPECDFGRFRQHILEAVADGARVVSAFR